MVFVALALLTLIFGLLPLLINCAHLFRPSPQRSDVLGKRMDNNVPQQIGPGNDDDSDDTDDTDNEADTPEPENDPLIILGQRLQGPQPQQWQAPSP